ncbi:hypothetical protein WMF30_22080 [Sorangium sp. So ce134]
MAVARLIPWVLPLSMADIEFLSDYADIDGAIGEAEPPGRRRE